MVWDALVFSLYCLFSIVKYVVQLFEEALFPQLCSYCKISIKNGFLCELCLSYLQPVVTRSLIITHTYKVTVHAVGAYQDPLQFLIRRKHYKDRAAARALGHLVWDYTAVRDIAFDVIVPIPLHWTRYAKRWFNQAYEMATIISFYSKKPVLCVLNRHKKTAFQARKSKQERFANVQEVFSLQTSLQAAVEGKHVLLVDDVMTTGATLTHAIKLLRTAHPASITVAVAARVV